MSNLNLCQIIGRLGRDVEIKYLPSGKAIANLTVAVSESWKDKETGDRKEVCEWFQVVMFGRQAEVADEFLKKGSLVYLAGKIKTRSWEKDGAKHYKTELHAEQMQFLDRRPSAAGEAQSFDRPVQPVDVARSRPAAPKAPAVDFDDDLPFN